MGELNEIRFASSCILGVYGLWVLVKAAVVLRKLAAGKWLCHSLTQDRVTSLVSAMFVLVLMFLLAQTVSVVAGLTSAAELEYWMWWVVDAGMLYVLHHVLGHFDEMASPC